MRKNEDKQMFSKWDRHIQLVADYSWAGETIFDLFYKQFNEGCRSREKIIKNLMQGRVADPRFETWRCKMSRTLAIALLLKVGETLRHMR